MKRSHPDQMPRAERRGERGAALITTLLLSTLLLLAGGALIVKSSGAVSTSYDASTEMQAYYAAEAGLQAALNVMRGNAQNGAADKATFRNAVDLSNGSMGAWLGYVNGVVPVGDYGYTISVVDAGVPPAAAGIEPDRIRITATGFGPRGSRRQLSLLMRDAADIDIVGGVVLRGRTGGTSTMTFDLGTSAQRNFISEDGSRPVFITTNAADSTAVTNFIDGDKDQVTYAANSHGNTDAGTAQMPSFLTSPATVEALIEDLQAAATDDNDIKIVDGDYTPGKNESGILVVRGRLNFGGNTVFNGIVLVVGKGEVEWKGEGTINGALFVANYNDDETGFDAPYFNLDGAGTSTINFSPTTAGEALEKLSFRIIGVQEQ